MVFEVGKKNFNCLRRGAGLKPNVLYFEEETDKCKVRMGVRMCVNMRKL